MVKTITDKTAETCRSALAQVLRDAETHAKTAKDMSLPSTTNWQKMVAEIKAAASELASA